MASLSMLCCAANGRLHCGALPVAVCFGMPPDWRFQISQGDRQWKRKLPRHEQLHQDHLPQADSLLRHASLMCSHEDGWKCQKCGSCVAALPLALAHTCPKWRNQSLCGKCSSRNGEQEVIPMVSLKPVVIRLPPPSSRLW